MIEAEDYGGVSGLRALEGILGISLNEHVPGSRWSSVVQS